MNKATILTFLVLAICLAGCNSATKLAQKCAELYPLRDSLIVREHIATDTIILGGYEVVYVDTIDCPASPTPQRIIDTVRYSLAPRIVQIERLVSDTTWIRSPTELAKAIKCPECAKNCPRPRWLPVWADRLVYTLLGLIIGLIILALVAMRIKL